MADEDDASFVSSTMRNIDGAPKLSLGPVQGHKVYATIHRKVFPPPAISNEECGIEDFKQ